MSTTGQRLLSLAARLPGALLPLAVGLALSTTGFWIALGIAVLAFAGLALGRWLAPLAARSLGWPNVLLCSAVAFVILTVLLIAAAQEQALWTASALALAAGLCAPAETAAQPQSRLDRTSIVTAFIIAVICGLASAWSAALVAAAFLAAAAVPILVMTRAAQAGGQESSEDQISGPESR